MNPIETMEHDVRKSLPTAWTRLRRPRNQHGQWWLDINQDGHFVTVQWSSRQGFGVNASAFGDGYGGGPDETFTEAPETTARVLELLVAKQHTNPPQKVSLHELRGLVGYTQAEVAEKLGVQQAAISRFERRDDVTLSTLRRYVSAMGADLEISVRMASGEHVEIASADEPTRDRAACSHVEKLLHPSAPRLEPSDVDYRAWLSEFEDTASDKWSFSQVPHHGTRKHSCLASSNRSSGSIGLNRTKASELASCVWQSVQKDAASVSPESAWHAALRFLLAHEVGHLVNWDDSPIEAPAGSLRDRELQADAVAGWLGGRAGDDAVLGSMIASRVGCRLRNCTHPSPEKRSYAYLIGHIEGSRFSKRSPGMTLVVIRTVDLERSRDFYSTLGLSLQPEKHGTGPLHYSCSMNGTVVELYPTKRKVTGWGRFGLRLRSPKKAVQRLCSAGHLSDAPPPTDSQSDVLLIRDPDGNELELSSL